MPSWSSFFATLPFMAGAWLAPAILFMVLELINRRYVIFLPLSVASFLLSAYLAVGTWWARWFEMAILKPPQSVAGIFALWSLLVIISVLVCLTYRKRQRRRRARSRWV